MANLSDVLIPFGTKASAYRLLDALKSGQKSNDELVTVYKVAKASRSIQNIVAIVNKLYGIRVRSKGRKMADPDNVWELVITDPTCILIKDAKGRASSVPTATAAVFTPKAPKAKGKGYVPPELAKWVLDSAKDGENIFLVGPTGSGKTVMAKWIADQMGAVFIRQNFDGETTIDNLIGQMSLKNEDGVTITEWEDGELTRAVRLASNGTKVVYLADEVTAGQPNVLFKFHRVLEVEDDGTRTMEVNGEVLTVPAGMLTIIGASNSFRADETGQYAGTNQMNAAFANRWSGGVFTVDYAENEAEILQDKGIDVRISKALVSMAKAIRRESKAQSMDITCSTRNLVSIGKKAMKWGCLKAIEHVYISTLTSDEYEQVVQPVLAQMSFPC